MCFPKYEGHSGQFWTMSNTGCMSGRGRDNSGNETRAVAARTMAWELWWLLRVRTREIWWQGRASQVPPFRSTAVTGVTRIIFYDWNPDYLQLTSKYKLKCTKCTSKLLVPAHTYLDVMFHIVWSILSVFGLYAGLLHSVQTFPDIGWPAAAGVGLPLVQSNTALSQADTVSTVDTE